MTSLAGAPYLSKFDGFSAETPDDLVANLDDVGLKVRSADFGDRSAFLYRYTYVSLPGMRLTSVISSPYSIHLECPSRCILTLASEDETLQEGARQSTFAPAGTVSHTALEDLRADLIGGTRLRTYFDAAELEERMKRWTGGRTFAVDLSTRSFADDWRGPMLRSAMLQAAETLSAIPDGSVRVARFLNADEAFLRSVALCFSESFFAYCQSPPMQASSKQVRRADDFIADHASKPLRVADIAEAAGVSERSLQLSFKRELGCSPMDRVRERRLSLAFDAMRAASVGTTVTSIAATFGFRNAGDFSVLFRQRFGHLPSEILKRVPMSTPDADL